MHLDAVAAGGFTPNSDGWRVESLLNVGMHNANDPVVAPAELPEEGVGLTATVSESSLFDVRRTARSHPHLKPGGASI
jgi:hypothetical protein